jgi:hypothetical protein
VYKSYVFGSEFPSAIVQTGQFEEDALVYRGELTGEGMKFKLRNVTRLVAPSKIVSEEYIAPEGRKGLQSLDNSRSAHAAADAHRHHSVASASPLEFTHKACR